MDSLHSTLTLLGQFAFDRLLFPVALWSVVAWLLRLLVQQLNLHPHYQYHLRGALLLALPGGLALSALTEWLGTIDTARPVARFIVIQSPIAVSATSTVNGDINLLHDPSLWIGMVTFLALLGAGFMLLRFAASYFMLHLYFRADPLRNLAHLESLNTANRTLLNRTGRKVYARFSGEQETPVTYGLRRPVIILPAGLLRNPDRLNVVLRHELIHIARFDYLLHGLFEMVRCLFWFHPLVHRIYHDITEYREISCDAEVLADHDISRQDYAELLLEMTHRPSFNRYLSVSMACKPSMLKKRIQLMHQQQTNRPSQLRSMLALSLVFFGLAGLISCTEMQSDAPDGSQLVDQTLHFDNPTVTVNGEHYKLQQATLEAPANGIAWITLPGGQTYLVSGQKFNQARPVGKIEGNQLRFSLHMDQVSITSEQPILSSGSADVWVSETMLHLKDKNRMPALGSAPNYETFSEARKKYAGTPGTGDGEYKVVKKMPELIGGLSSIQSKITYPDEARKAGVEGRVFVQFIVNNDGQVEDPKVVKGIGYGCDEVALAAVKDARFKPGEVDGEAVPVKMSLPIIFRLSQAQ